MMEGEELTAVVLPSTVSEHWPISMEWERMGVNLRRPFCFEQLRLLHPKFPKKLKQWWTDFYPIKGTLMYWFQQKLNILKGKIKRWNIESFGNIFQEKKQFGDEYSRCSVERHATGIY